MGFKFTHLPTYSITNFVSGRVFLLLLLLGFHLWLNRFRINAVRRIFVLGLLLVFVALLLVGWLSHASLDGAGFPGAASVR